MRKARGRPVVDMAGKRIGRLTVLRQGERRGAGRTIYWVCRCDCGVEKEISGAAIRAGDVQSCGCYHREVMRKVGLKTGRTVFGKKRVHNLPYVPKEEPHEP